MTTARAPLTNALNRADGRFGGWVANSFPRRCGGDHDAPGLLASHAWTGSSDRGFTQSAGATNLTPHKA